MRERDGERHAANVLQPDKNRGRCGPWPPGSAITGKFLILIILKDGELDDRQVLPFTNHNRHPPLLQRARNKGSCYTKFTVFSAALKVRIHCCGDFQLDTQ